ncbi:prepilin peptidase [Canibacter zhoujuaniae]|uniref:prepilin peptidase n=1 Tax=Canibacter zhoujuaniae TaxID=2708343 RepID=UPI00142415A7|nr:prepilin peptidase [Canibacter zhoujuaniae]
MFAGLSVWQLLLHGALLAIHICLVRIDFAERRLPNPLVLSATVCSVLLWFAEGAAVAHLLWALGVSAVLLVLKLVAPHAIGWGDVKLFPSLLIGMLTYVAPAVIVIYCALVSLFLFVTLKIAVKVADGRLISRDPQAQKFIAAGPALIFSYWVVVLSALLLKAV